MKNSWWPFCFFYKFYFILSQLFHYFASVAFLYRSIRHFIAILICLSSGSFWNFSNSLSVIVSIYSSQVLSACSIKSSGNFGSHLSKDSTTASWQSHQSLTPIPSLASQWYHCVWQTSQSPLSTWSFNHLLKFSLVVSSQSVA